MVRSQVQPGKSSDKEQLVVLSASPYRISIDFFQIQTADVKEVASHQRKRLLERGRGLCDVCCRIKGKHGPARRKNFAGACLSVRLYVCLSVILSVCFVCLTYCPAICFFCLSD